MPVPFIDLHAQRARLAGRIDAAIAQVLKHGQFVFGPEVARFEQSLANFCNARHVVACANGTDALRLALMASSIGEKKDAVFLPAFTFAATAAAPLLSGATPFFVDITHDYTIDLDSLQRGLTQAREQGLRPRALISVDLYGLPVDYEPIANFAKEQNLLFIADGAQSCGACYKNRPVGGLADITTFSFFPTKPLAAYGDGGALATDDAEHAYRLRLIANHGQDRRYHHKYVGFNSRLDSLQAAVLLVKLDVLEEEIAARERAARLYNRLLSDAVETPRLFKERSSAWAQYTIASDSRETIAAACSSRGVESFVHYPQTLCSQPAYRSCPVVSGGVPMAERAARRVLSLPMHPDLDTAAQQLVAECVVQALKSPSGWAKTGRAKETAAG